MDWSQQEECFSQNQEADDKLNATIPDDEDENGSSAVTRETFEAELDAIHARLNRLQDGLDLLLEYTTGIHPIQTTTTTSDVRKGRALNCSNSSVKKSH